MCYIFPQKFWLILLVFISWFLLLNIKVYQLQLGVGRLSARFLPIELAIWSLSRLISLQNLRLLVLLYFLRQKAKSMLLIHPLVLFHVQLFSYTYPTTQVLSTSQFTDLPSIGGAQGTTQASHLQSFLLQFNHLIWPKHPAQRLQWGRVPFSRLPIQHKRNSR